MRAVACAIAVGVCGCSFVFVQGPTASRRACTRNLLAPGLDGAVAAFGAGMLKAELSPCSGPSCNAGATVGIAAGTAVFAAATVYGLTKVTACHLQAFGQPTDPNVPQGGVAPDPSVHPRTWSRN